MHAEYSWEYLWRNVYRKKISRHDEIIYIYRRMSTHHMDLEVPYHEPESKCFLIGQIIRHKFDMYLLITLTSVLTKSRNILRLISKKPRPKTVRIQECNNFWIQWATPFSFPLPLSFSSWRCVSCNLSCFDVETL